MIIYHITHQRDWDNALKDGAYTAPSLDQEGFIHASTFEQVAATGDRYYQGEHGLILLVIDTDMVKPEVRFDPVQLKGAETRFPHIYGPLNLNAVVDRLGFEPDASGHFQPPARS